MSNYSYIEVSEMENNTFIVKNKSNGKFVKMGKQEFDYYLMAREADFQEESDCYSGDLSQEQRAYLYEKFCEWGFIKTGESGEPVEQETKKDKFRLFKGDITTIKLGYINPNAFLDRCLPIIRALYHPIALFIYICMIISSLVLFSKNPDALSVSIDLQLNKESIIPLYIMIILTIFIHELGHASACKYFGGRVERIGFMIFYFNPAMYCDISDVYLFKDKGKKIAVAFAGIFTQWILSSIAILLYFLLSSMSMEQPLLLQYAFVNIGVSVINLVPFVKLDGYWILTYIFDISNLRSKSLSYIFSLLIFNQDYRKQFEKKEKTALITYGTLAMLYTPFMWGGAIYGIYEMVWKYSSITSWSITACLIVILCMSFTTFIMKQWKLIRQYSESAVH